MIKDDENKNINEQDEILEESEKQESEVKTGKREASETIEEPKVEEPKVGTKEPADETCQEQLLRLNADFQNFKRRITKERADWAYIAQAQILDMVLPIFDDLDRAIELSEQKGDGDKSEWLDGFKLMQKKWQKLFKDLQIEEIAATDEFDPELHEALMQVEDPEKKPGQIVQFLSKGYRFKDKVLKHAKVSVAK